MATMRDVATRAGVSKQTVSNVLNGRDRSPFVTPETRERILRAIAELDYHPDSNARGLRNGRTRILGFIVVDESPAFLSDLFHSAVASGIAEAVRASDQWLLIHGLAPGATTTARLLQPFLQRRIDGAVVTLSGPREIREACLQRLVEGPCPFVLFEQRVDCPHGAGVLGDNADGARRAVAHLLRQGHRRIAVLAGPSAWPAVERRVEGYTGAMRDAGMEPLVFVGARRDNAGAQEWSLHTGQRLGEEMLEAQPGVTAIVAANDVLAAGAMRAIKARGRRVPDDVAVIGFDDFEFAAYLEPPLTTVKLAGLEMGRKAAQMLLHYAAEGSFAEKEVTFPMTLVARASA